MLKKWYISGLVVILALLGVNQKQTIKPNQEMVLRFSNIVVDVTNVNNAILKVEKQLSDIGAKNITFFEDVDGLFKITYYSNLDVNTIKQILSEKHDSDLALEKETNKDQNSTQDPYKPYDFDIKQLDEGLNNDLGGKASMLAELKLDKPRSFTSNVFALVNIIEIKQQNTFEKRFKIFCSVILSTDNFSFQIPDVRAGPTC